MDLITHTLIDNPYPNGRFPRPGFENQFRSKKPVQVIPTPPHHDQKALTARYVVHVSDWGSLATVSSQVNSSASRDELADHRALSVSLVFRME